MLAIKYVFKYLKATDLCYKQRDSNILTGHIDTNWVGCSHDKVSNTWYLFRLGETPITWNSNKQTITFFNQSWIHGTYKRNKGGHMVAQTTPRNSSASRHNSNNDFGDNQGSLKLVHNSVFHSCTKHVDVQHHFIRKKWNQVKLL